jgi:4-amino-4-deoxychorismate lyase
VTVRLLAILGEGLTDPDAPAVAADDAGVTRGDGCFEGCRVLTSADGVSTVDKLDAHLARMQRSAEALEIAFDRPAWASLVESACQAWHVPGEAGMKLVLTRGRPGSPVPTGLLTVSDLPAHYPRQRRDGLRVISLTRGTSEDSFAGAPWLLGGVKTLSYAVNMAAVREAERQGADDALFVSVEGRVLESTISSVVWSVGRTLLTTPTGATGILGGTTQQLLFDRAAAAGWRTEVTSASLEDLHGADVVWLIGSVRGPVDVVGIDGTSRIRRPSVDAEIRHLAGFPGP